MINENRTATALAHRIVAGAVANASPLDEVKDLIEHQIRNSIRVDEDGNLNVVDANGIPRISTRPGFPNMTLDELMDEFKASRPNLFRSPGSVPASTASGGPHTDPGNPFSRAGWNITEQMQIMKSDPARAARLQAEAGR